MKAIGSLARLMQAIKHDYTCTDDGVCDGGGGSIRGSLPRPHHPGPCTSRAAPPSRARGGGAHVGCVQATGGGIAVCQASPSTPPHRLCQHPRRKGRRNQLQLVQDGDACWGSGSMCQESGGYGERGGGDRVLQPQSYPQPASTQKMCANSTAPTHTAPQKKPQQQTKQSAG
jgi:hypothetical protein